MHIKKNKTFWLRVEFSLVMHVVNGDQSWREYGDPQVQNNTTFIQDKFYSKTKLSFLK